MKNGFFRALHFAASVDSVVVAAKNSLYAFVWCDKFISFSRYGDMACGKVCAKKAATHIHEYKNVFSFAFLSHRKILKLNA